MGAYQDNVRAEYEERGYNDDLVILGLGLCEEAGEVCAAILDMNGKFKPRDGRSISCLEHELEDCLTYLCAIANSAGIELGI